MSDTYPIRLKGNPERKAILIVPENFTRADAERIAQWARLIAEQSDDFVTRPEPEQSK